jgi:hypothetical protein
MPSSETKPSKRNVSTQFSSEISSIIKNEAKSKPVTHPLKRKLSKNAEKENQGIKDLTKLEAELNLKTFMKNFELTSRNDPKPLDSTYNSLSSRKTTRHSTNWSSLMF